MNINGFKVLTMPEFLSILMGDSEEQPESLGKLETSQKVIDLIVDHCAKDTDDLDVMMTAVTEILSDVVSSSSVVFDDHYRRVEYNNRLIRIIAEKMNKHEQMRLEDEKLAA